jgi:hypothetical protein
VNDFDETWDVRREWLPRHAWFVRRAGAWRDKRKDKRRGDVFDVLDAPTGSGGPSWDFSDLLDDLFVGLVAVVVVAVVSAFAWLFIVPLLLAILDVIVIVVLVVAGIIARVLLRRPWTVSARSSKGRQLQWQVVGWRRSGRAAQVIAQALRVGQDPDVALAVMNGKLQEKVH